MNATDGQTDRRAPHDSVGRLCIAMTKINEFEQKNLANMFEKTLTMHRKINTVSYSPSVVTMAVSLAISEIFNVKE